MLEMLEGFLSRTFPKIRPEPKITRITEANGSTVWATTDCNFCMNVMKEHNNAGIYFQINKSGVCQRCFCKCDTVEGRLTGKRCSEYASQKFLLPPKLYKHFFGTPPASYSAKQKKNSGTAVQWNGGTDKVSFLSNLITSIKENN